MQEDMDKSVLSKGLGEKREFRQPANNRYGYDNSFAQSASSRAPNWKYGANNYYSKGQARNSKKPQKLVSSSGSGAQNVIETECDGDFEVSEFQELELGFFYGDGLSSRQLKTQKWPKHLSKKAHQLYTQSRSSSNHYWQWQDSTKFYNKELFMQANCQFVVREGPDFTAFMKDPDLLVDWDFIEEVRTPAYDVQCPICLFPPKVAKITKCGHIYCHPCVLQYISYDNDSKSKKCAICAEHIYPKDLRSVLPQTVQTFSEGDEITMVLMRKSKGHTQVFSVQELDKGRRKNLSDSVPIHIKDSPNLTRFSKLLVASAEEVSDLVVSRELAELAQIDLESDEIQKMYVQTVDELLESRLAMLKIDVPSDRMLFKSANASKSCEEDGDVEELQLGLEEYLDPPLEVNAESTRRAKTTSLCEESAFFFYQCEDGQHIYLHSINWQCLVKEYGCMENCPPIITAKILQLDRLSMNSAMRKRVPYLRHLPLTCGLTVVELDLKPLLSRDTLIYFADKLYCRQKERQAKIRYDKFLSKVRDKEEKRMLGDDILYHTVPSAMLEITENPTFTEADPPLPSAATVTPSNDPTPDTTSPKSFAQVMRNKPRVQAVFPTVSNPAPPTAIGEDEPSTSTPKTYSMGDTLSALIDAQLAGNQSKSQKQIKKQRKKQKQFFAELSGSNN